ncbi:Sialyltransferase-like protein 2 [Asimina triloba]
MIQRENGLGLEALSGSDYCQVSIRFPSDTVPKWRDPKTGKLEGSSFDFNLCKAVATWEQHSEELGNASVWEWGIELDKNELGKVEEKRGDDVIWWMVRNSTTILTKEFIDALPNGWEDYAWRRINKGVLLNHCENKALCMEKLALVLPETPPLVPRHFGRCAVIGNSGDLLKTNFGEEIDGYDAVVRENGAPIQNYTKYVGRKSTFRLLNRGSAKALDKVVELDETRREVLIIKTTIHDIMNQMIQEVPIKNPVYLMLGASFGSAAKGTGLKALEFALSICDSVDMYGFTVDPGRETGETNRVKTKGDKLAGEFSLLEGTEPEKRNRINLIREALVVFFRTRYFSESRQGHTPLHGRAYYQMMECLGLIKIHSPMRTDFNRVVTWVPSQSTLRAAQIASEKILRRVGAGMDDPLRACSIIKKRDRMKAKATKIVGLRKAASDHRKYVKGASMYPLEHNTGHGMLCTIPED